MTTEYRHIKDLLQRFMEARTSEAEEAKLVRYFQTAGDIPQEWQAYKDMFMLFASGNVGLSESEKAEVVADEPTVIPVRRHWLAIAGSIAACAAIFLAIFFLWSSNEGNDGTDIVAQHKEVAGPSPTIRKDSQLTADSSAASARHTAQQKVAQPTRHQTYIATIPQKGEPTAKQTDKGNDPKALADYYIAKYSNEYTPLIQAVASSGILDNDLPLSAQLTTGQ